MERYIGKMLDNRYEILEVIGTGGMAVVFKAKCHRLNRLVAIKMLKKDLSDDAEFRRRFHDESQAVAMLSHPNIMAVYDVSRGGDMDYIVMELIDGITLKQYMERRGKLNWPEALHFITQIMKGLSHAHGRGIIHRDIKPQNIMVLRDGTVKVTDFGIATLINNTNAVNEAIGSVHYISPEQAKGDSTDNRSDIYSAGVVLYEMLASRLPFEGDNPVSVAIQHLNGMPLSPREINSAIPEALEQICMKAMATDRKRRYATADAMLADLEAFRKDPSLSFDYSVEDLQGECSDDDEPTQFLPNVAVTRTRPAHFATPVEEDGYEEDDRPRFSWIKPLILIALCAAIGYFAVTHIYGAIMSSFDYSEVPEYTVPNVVGMTVEEALALPDVEGVFTIVEAFYENSDRPIGEILKQDPEKDRTKKMDGDNLIPINVTISSGARSGGMPDLVGEEFRSAKLRLDQDKELSKLKLEVVEGEAEYHDEIEEGHVIRTVPAAGEVLSEGDTVTLILSKGPKIKYVDMISCEGQSMDWVQLEMNKRNLVAEFQSVEGAEKVGTVLSQSINAGDQVPEGTTVVFTYSNGEKEIEQKISFHVPFNFFPVSVEMYLDNTLVFSSELPGDYGLLEQTVYAKAGTYQLRIFVNDQLREDRVIVFQ